MTKAGKGALSPIARSEGTEDAGAADQKADGRDTVAQGEAPHADDRKVDRRRNQAKTVEVERRRGSRRYSDRVAASFTSAFVAQWLGQEIAGGQPGDELSLRRSANLVYNAVRERESQYFRSLGRNAKKTHDYS
jgi:hypothetical protein